MTRVPSARLLGLLGLLGLFLAACTEHAPLPEPLLPDAGGAAGADVGGGEGGDGGGDDCQPTNGSIEICDSIDNDCDGETDEGFDLWNDPRHCGDCRLACAYENGTGRCEDRRCSLDSCLPGFANIDGDEENGCEEDCEITNGGIELCDIQDNDCDGETDEDFDLLSDTSNCGRCGMACRVPNGVTVCDAGTCGLDRCEEGAFDVDGLYSNGCEADCAESNDGVEICDAVDNDCDGVVDEDFDLFADLAHCGECGHACEFRNATPSCLLGRCVMGPCDPGFADIDLDPETGCEIECDPTNDGIEVCDAADNDCDGETDEGFDLLTDVDHCGECGGSCAFANGVAACAEGECALASCEPGFANADLDLRNGCEAPCDRSLDGFEACDQVDNDCDGETDEGWDLLGDPFNCGACGTLCAFANAVAACAEGECALERCEPGFIDEDERARNGCEVACVPTNGGQELCDDLDNDCDGLTDEEFDLVGDPNNCGACFFECELAQAEAHCLSGVCRVTECADGWHNADQDHLNGCELECEPTDDGVEACDEVDNDCDGRTDEGFDVLSNVRNCGECGRECEVERGGATCDQGECGIGLCDDGWNDADGRLDNGCEFACDQSNGGVEICDGLDNDCDRVPDDGFDLQANASHCGECGRSCALLHAVVACEEGECLALGCEADWWDLDEDMGGGCEYHCEGQPGADEACNEADDDCDGEVDEGFDLLSDQGNCGVCGRSCDLPHADGECIEGGCVLHGCDEGWHDADGHIANGCEYDCVPSDDGFEVCDGIDNDCNGLTDEIFDLENDVLNCGECGLRCDLAGADSFCDSGECAVLACDEARVDVDQLPDNGCECAMSNGGVEKCDALDNDCDGLVDNDAVNPPIDCSGFGVCEEARPLCTEGAWACSYPDTHEPDRETLCDGLDNDCNGRTDEAHPEKGAVCAAGEGACQEVGAMVCTEDGAGVECTAIDHPEQSSEEICNGIDDDCDGETDEDSDHWVEFEELRIYRYEASRTDASPEDSGVSFQRACSRPGVMPWSVVDWGTAALACERAGGRLCTGAEWLVACAGVDGRAYPYADEYDAEACNGADHLAEGPVASGSLEGCATPEGVADLSGNVWEWIDVDRSDEGDGSIRAFVGGGYGNIPAGLRCDFEVAAEPATARDNIGFRCCADIE